MPTIGHLYHYRLRSVERVIDGDTFDAIVDLGFHVNLKIRIRLDGVDAWELRPPHIDTRGLAARRFATDWLSQNHPLIASTERPTPHYPVPDGAFGRWIAEITAAPTGETLQDALRTNGHLKSPS